MPLFQYVCADCGGDAEILVRNGEVPVCPACSSPKMSKQLSRVNALAGAPDPAPAMGCGASSCCQMTGGGCMN